MKGSGACLAAKGVAANLTQALSVLLFAPRVVRRTDLFLHQI